jgi:N-acetylglucosaminyldiphosphoundecaprenol N-acetyl-beta-D-mannosaminyltransferase
VFRALIKIRTTGALSEIRLKVHQLTQASSSALPGDLTREVYGVLGIPVDIIEMPTVLRRIESAAANAEPFLISTPNLDHLVTSRTDAEFRETLLRSNLCTADGMPIVWIARLLGVPIKNRIAGADIFESLKNMRDSAQRLRVFLFGGIEGAAAAACAKLNAEPSSVMCAGSYDPGFCSVEAMSTDGIFETLNSSQAEFLAVALGAKKGQAWLLRNHDRLKIPVRVHLGATINFQAGTLKRAPEAMRRWGLEWLWRIKEEPYLWRRYWVDGMVLVRLILTKVLPLMILARRNQSSRRKMQAPRISSVEEGTLLTLKLAGSVTAENIGTAILGFQKALIVEKDVALDLSNVVSVDARFFGLLLMLRKRLIDKKRRLRIGGVSPQVARLFRLNGFEYLLDS